MLNNSGLTITIYNISEIVRVAFPLSGSDKNIQSGFSLGLSIKIFLKKMNTRSTMSQTDSIPTENT